MSNPMKYVKDLEAAGFERAQAEAQVQVVLDALEGDLLTKTDFDSFKGEFNLYKVEMKNQFDQIDSRFRELELRLLVRTGMMVATSTTITIAVLGWLIKSH